MATVASTDQAGVYVGPTPDGIPVGACILKVVYGAFDTADDTDDLPELRTPSKIELAVKPNLAGPVTLPDLTVMLVESTVLSSTDGVIAFKCIDLQRADVSQTANWTATLKVDGKPVSTFTFTPDSTAQTPHNLGADLPLMDPVTGSPTTRGVGIATMDTDTDGNLVITLTNGVVHVWDLPSGGGGGGSQGPAGVGVQSITADGSGNAVFTMTNGDTHTIPLPAGQPGTPGTNGTNAPAVGMSGDQITIGGTITGPHLTGPAGSAPTVGMSGDQITIGGTVTGPHLTGPAGATPTVGMSGDQLTIGGTVTGPHLTGPQGLTGNTGAAGAGFVVASTYAAAGAQPAGTVIISTTGS